MIIKKTLNEKNKIHACIVIFKKKSEKIKLK